MHYSSQNSSQIFLVCAICISMQVESVESLSNAQLDEVTAGNADKSLRDVMPIKLDRVTARGTHIVIDGDAQLLSSNVTNTLLLSDNAQKNLTSLININAVNAPVNVLLNLNINIDSVVETLQQFNVLNGDVYSKQ